MPKSKISPFPVESIFKLRSPTVSVCVGPAINHPQVLRWYSDLWVYESWEEDADVLFTGVLMFDPLQTHLQHNNELFTDILEKKLIVQINTIINKNGCKKGRVQSNF
ncbi:MAG: hypothetical protein F6J98_01750 [Moorea sp. SIO4G2]|nr:hypothetical protein [Moorena sp. SIO4G2]